MFQIPRDWKNSLPLRDLQRSNFEKTKLLLLLIKNMQKIVKFAMLDIKLWLKYDYILYQCWAFD